MSQMTSGRLTASQRNVIAGTVWHHPGDLRRMRVGSRDGVGRILGGNAVLVAIEDCFGLEDCAEPVVVLVVDSEERVVLFVGDSTGGGKSLGWLRVATMMVLCLVCI